LENVSKGQESTVSFPKLPLPITREAINAIQSAADNLAKAASSDWKTNSARALLTTLAAVGPEFREKRIPSETHARRAERLVLALDRVSLDLPAKDRTELNPHLDQLFKLSQNIPEFSASQFADELEKLQKKLSAL
jgi:hypothetical protein